MSFPKAKRFLDSNSGRAPPPTAYNAIAPWNHEACDRWSRPNIVTHKCDGKCSSIWCEEGFVDPFTPHHKNFATSSRCSLVDNPEERHSNKENVLKKKPSSNIPKLKRVERAPSFLTRPKQVHSCLTQVSPVKNNFNRFSINRKTVKPVKKKVGTGAVPKKPQNDLAKFEADRENLDPPPEPSNVSKKEDELAREISKDLGTKRFYELTFQEGPSEAKKIKNDSGELREYDLASLEDCSMTFLVAEEFIDDDYDWYLKSSKCRRTHSEILQNKEILEMTQNLVRVYLQKKHHASEGQLKKSIRRKFGKLFLKRKKPGLELNWTELERIVREAILELKGEFRREIYEETNAKLQQLLGQLQKTFTEANEGIDDRCERTAVKLVAQLENLALKKC